ncbi:leucyl aminopeptidase [Streptomyces sp. NPDC058735]|uniref:leucyl aminopeptidase n=1 Tax=unclassified Streptomyces TaxID=2593676 RepID=UPI0036B9C5AD
MSVEWRLCPEATDRPDAVVVPVWAGELPPYLPTAFLAATGFTGAVGDVLQLPGEPVRVLLGFGRRADLDRAAIRTAAARVARAVASYRRLAVQTPGPDLRPLVEGYLLGGYQFARYRGRATTSATQRISLLTRDTAEARRALAEGRRLGGAVRLARDLVNEPGEVITPEGFAERARGVAVEAELAYEAWDTDRMAVERLGGLLGVSRGSLQPPRLVRLRYRPASWSRRVALIGKGVTFDAGGLSLKANAHLMGMKADMAGAAAVLGAMSVLPALGCPVAVDAWLPLTENMPNADPVRIGDVLTMRDGTTVEICHADAEGRLIMADVLVLAGESCPDAIVDIATLTDAAAIALGRRIAAVMGNDPALVDRLLSAGDRTGEPLWPLPLPDAYRGQLTSQVADLVNYTVGNRHGTCLLAGLFLREFVPRGTPWAHLDIQGTALCDADDGEWVAGGTGFGVRTLVDLLASGG